RLRDRSRPWRALCIATCLGVMKLRPPHMQRCGVTVARAPMTRSPRVRSHSRSSCTPEIAMPLRAFGLNCTLKSGSEPSSTQKLVDQLLQALGKHGVESSHARVADFNVKAGVKADEGGGDQWPELRQKVMDAQILVLATPVWMGQPSSLAKRVLERMDAFLGEIDEQGRYPTFGKVAVAAVVGNEDGAHHVCAELYQALTDVGFTIPGGTPPYW